MARGREVEGRKRHRHRSRWRHRDETVVRRLPASHRMGLARAASAARVRGAATAACTSWVNTRFRCSTRTRTKPIPTARPARSTSSRRRWSTLRASRASGNRTTSSSRRRDSRSGKLAKPGYVTVLHNGVLVQNHTEIEGTTAWDRAPAYEPHAAKLPIQLQDHGNPVRYRNIWIREL